MSDPEGGSHERPEVGLVEPVTVAEAIAYIADFTYASRHRKEDWWRWYNLLEGVEWMGNGGPPDKHWLIGVTRYDGNEQLLGWGATPNDAILALYAAIREWERTDPTLTEVTK